MKVSYQTSIRRCPICTTHLEIFEKTKDCIKYVCPSCANEHYLFEHSDSVIGYDVTETCLLKSEGCQTMNRGIWEQVGPEIHLLVGCYNKESACNGRNIRLIL
jgi:ribosomal protein S27E